MKRFPPVIGVVTAIVLLTCVPVSQATALPSVTITLLNPPPSGLLELDVGESYIFDVEIASDEPFILAMALPNQYYPGRGIKWHGCDQATHSTSAVLHLTMTGKNSTADLPAVCFGPEPDDCWPEGVAPASIVAGVRFKGGQVVSEAFSFAVVVP
jgi:hypothetical protein